MSHCQFGISVLLVIVLFIFGTLGLGIAVGSVWEIIGGKTPMMSSFTFGLGVASIIASVMVYRLVWPEMWVDDPLDPTVDA